VTTFLLIRHAESPWSPDNGRPLSPAGQLASIELAYRLAHIGPSALYASPYYRARQTVEPLADLCGLPVNTAADLRECSFGDLGDLPFETAAQLAWRNFDISWPGGETPRMAQLRILQFVRSFAAPPAGRPIVLATHGTLLTLLLNAFDPSVGHDFWLSLSHPDVFRLELHDSGGAAFSRVTASNP